MLPNWDALRNASEPTHPNCCENRPISHSTSYAMKLKTFKVQSLRYESIQGWPWIYHLQYRVFWSSLMTNWNGPKRIAVSTSCMVNNALVLNLTMIPVYKYLKQIHKFSQANHIHFHNKQNNKQIQSLHVRITYRNQYSTYKIDRSKVSLIIIYTCSFFYLSSADDPESQILLPLLTPSWHPCHIHLLSTLYSPEN